MRRATVARTGTFIGSRITLSVLHYGRLDKPRPPHVSVPNANSRRLFRQHSLGTPELDSGGRPDVFHAARIRPAKCARTVKQTATRGRQSVFYLHHGVGELSDGECAGCRK